MEESLTICFLGSQRRGSDPRALAAALRSRGHLLTECSYDEYLPQQWGHPLLRVARRALRSSIAAEYNRAVTRLASDLPIDFLLVFKGMLLAPDSLSRIREAGVPCYLFYPDVSFYDHGANIPGCLPLYDHIFTTKAFHLDNVPEGVPPGRMTLVNHGADPEVHRPILLPGALRAAYTCDASFVGCWSRKKERYLDVLQAGVPGLDLRIWGPGWGRASPEVRRYWQARGAWGDELAAIYTASRINLGLLSEAGTATSKGDQLTARTWQIPASGGFLLHEETEEFARYFRPGAEAGVFRDPESLVGEVTRYLRCSEEREAVRRAGMERALRSHYTYLPAAEEIVASHRERMVRRGEAKTSGG